MTTVAQNRLAAYKSKRKPLAVEIGVAFHDRIANLYTSSRASVVYGHGGQKETDWNAYAKSYGFPANWQNAGAYITGYGKSGRIVLETSRGTKKAELPMPPKGAVVSLHRGLIHGDLFLIERKIGNVRVATRYGPVMRNRVAIGYRKTGVAVRFALTPEQAEHWVSPNTPKSNVYWEHGETIEECRREFARKAELTTRKAAEKAATAKIQRAAALIARLCSNLTVTHADARAVGYCEAGIAGFAQRNGLSPDKVTVRRLRETGDPMTEKVITFAALRTAREKFATEKVPC